MVGTTNMVSSVPRLMPPTMTQPIWRRLSAPAPVASASGKAPSTMAPVVIKMGRRRCAADFLIAARVSSPCSRNWLANSTIKMPCLVINPTSVIRPIWLNTLSVPPDHLSAIRAPAIESGTLSRITNGSTKLSNCAASTRKMKNSASTNTSDKESADLRNSRLEPLRSVA